jgi:hypothetical protein
MASQMGSRSKRPAMVGEAEVRASTWVSEDVAFGQYVVVTARWILVAAGLILSLWVTKDAGSQAVLDQLKIQFLVIVALAFGNFYLNLQLLRRRPAVDAIAYAASLADIVVISLLIQTQGGFGSALYIFYFPALLAISIAFPREATLLYTVAAIGAYASISFQTIDARAALDQQTLMVRLAMFAAVSFCGALYYQIEHDRRRDAAAARDQMVAALDERS